MFHESSQGTCIAQGIYNGDKDDNSSKAGIVSSTEIIRFPKETLIKIRRLHEFPDRIRVEISGLTSRKVPDCWSKGQSSPLDSYRLVGTVRRASQVRGKRGAGRLQTRAEGVVRVESVVTSGGATALILGREKSDPGETPLDAFDSPEPPPRRYVEPETSGGRVDVGLSPRSAWPLDVRGRRPAFASLPPERSAPASRTRPIKSHAAAAATAAEAPGPGKQTSPTPPRGLAAPAAGRGRTSQGRWGAPPPPGGGPGP